MRELLSHLIFIGGVGQLFVLIASAMVPFRLDWKAGFQCLPRLHRQMYWVYGGYIVLSIVAFGLISLFNAQALAGGTRLARSFCLYVALFWGIRLVLQAVLDVKPHLTAWWLRLGYHGLTALFLYLTAIYGWAALYAMW
ncbi:MAG: hypothetical protein ABSG53_26415 [Thermoguttaceae bacterium]|jgi:hypothetical protein